jgi:SAM-dependent methyltransferase
VGIDVSKETLVQQADDPPNLELKIMDAVELDFPASSFDVAFSSQLIEHLHPDDVGLHLSAVYRVLREKGVYAFDTPNRLNGPHDVSKYFDEVATGFHLKEWTYRELACELKQAGFRQAQTMILPWSLVKHRASLRSLGTVSVSWVIPGETLVAKVKNRRSRNTLSKWFRVASIYIVAQK